MNISSDSQRSQLENENNNASKNKSKNVRTPKKIKGKQKQIQEGRKTECDDVDLSEITLANFRDSESVDMVMELTQNQLDEFPDGEEEIMEAEVNEENEQEENEQENNNAVRIENGSRAMSANI